MNAAELLIEREDDRVNYLCEPDAYLTDRIAHEVVLDKGSTYRFEARVIRFLDDRGGRVVLSLKAGAFGFQDSISHADARLLALALNVAADEADADAAGEGAV